MRLRVHDGHGSAILTSLPSPHTLSLVYDKSPTPIASHGLTHAIFLLSLLDCILIEEQSTVCITSKHESHNIRLH